MASLFGDEPADGLFGDDDDDMCTHPPHIHPPHPLTSTPPSHPHPHPHRDTHTCTRGAHGKTLTSTHTQAPPPCDFSSTLHPSPPPRTKLPSPPPTAFLPLEETLFPVLPAEPQPTRGGTLPSSLPQAGAPPPARASPGGRTTMRGVRPRQGDGQTFCVLEASPFPARSQEDAVLTLRTPSSLNPKSQEQSILLSSPLPLPRIPKVPTHKPGDK